MLDILSCVAAALILSGGYKRSVNQRLPPPGESESGPQPRSVVGFSYRDKTWETPGGGVEVTSYPKNQLGPSEKEGFGSV